MQNAILIAKVLFGSTKKKEIVVNTPNAEIMQLCSITNVLLKYNWHLNLTDNEAAINLELQSVKKY